MPVVTYRGIDKAIDHLISRVKGWFVALETSPSTSDLVEIRLQDLEELADRFITWYTNIVSRPYGDAFHHRSLEDSPELLGAVQEALQSINEDLMEGRSSCKCLRQRYLICNSPVIPKARFGWHQDVSTRAGRYVK